MLYVLHTYYLYCFAVGAIDTTDYRFNCSSYGPEIDMVAYSSINTSLADFWTLDQMGCNGRNDCDKDFLDDDTLWRCSLDSLTNDNDYFCHFSGTSATCPVVAGIASLIIAKDTMLTANEVYDILKNSAVKDLDWGTISDTPHVEYGYGCVDAFRAILSLAHGDVDNDDDIDMADITALIDYLYLTHTEPFPSILLSDCNCNGEIDVSDITNLTSYLYLSGPPPVKPCYVFEITGTPPPIE